MHKEIQGFCNNHDDLSAINSNVSLFDLSSHQRARDAINFALSIRDFHVFIIGEDRVGRVSSTFEFLQEKVKELPLSSDWVYLNNFEEKHRPKAFSLPPGKARILQEKMKELVSNAKTILQKILVNYLRKIESSSSNISKHFQEKFQKIQSQANELGILISDDGFKIEQANPSSYPLNKAQEVKDDLESVANSYYQDNQRLEKKIIKLRDEKAYHAIKPLFSKLISDMETQDKSILNWLESAHLDMIKNFEFFEENSSINPFEWYGVSILVDNYGQKHPKVIIEAQPTFDNLFGEIKYRSTPNLETNFTMIRPGALHRASGGVLILRAEQLCKNQDLWEDLKAAIRDKKLRVKEPYRENMLPLVDAPNPESIPLDVQIFLVGAPYWYYNFFFNDPDFKSYFKIKAEIDPDMPSSDENISVYYDLLQKEAIKLTGRPIDEETLSYILLYSSRMASHLKRLSSQFEIIKDIMIESIAISKEKLISKENIQKTILNRRDRNMRLEDYSYMAIEEGQVVLETKGHRVGQINGLTVMGADHSFGMPARITARTYAGDSGVMNIERLIDLSGPIQQKGSFIIEGFLNGLFSQSFQLPCGISLTFEQNYGDVEGDSASLGELIAILSSLSNIPVRQDVAVTGSMDQMGRAQAVGGIHHKIEGFHRVCVMHGLTGTQGVIIPKSNVVNLTLRDDVLSHIDQGLFYIWTVHSIYEALEIMLNHPCGLQLDNSGFPTNNVFAKDSIFEKAFRKLKSYRKSITLKENLPNWKSFI